MIALMLLVPSGVANMDGEIGLLTPAHLESFQHFFELETLSPTDQEAATRELRLRIALEQDNVRALGQNLFLARRMDACRRSQGTRHACKKLLYGGMHESCEHSS